MAIVSTLETKYELITMDGEANKMTLVITVDKETGFAPGLTEEQVVLAIYNRLVEAFPTNEIQANRVRTVREDDLV
jgi:hypothetical protein